MPYALLHSRTPGEAQGQLQLEQDQGQTEDGLHTSLETKAESESGGDMKIAVLDLETTGFDPRDCIVEIGVCELDLEAGATLALLNMPVREPHFTKAQQHSWIFRHSDLKFWDVMNATPWKNAERELQWILSDYPITAFNKAFDFAFLKHRGLVPRRELPCPMIMAAGILKIPGFGGHKWPTLEEAWEHYFPGLDYIEQHRAFDDALHEALLIRAMHTAGDYNIKEEVE
jgi:DNA polymerase-3 subunit epsilon